MSTEPRDPQLFPPALPPATPSPRTARNPVVAGLLSLVMPGLGQMYNGQYAKAFAFFFGFVGSLYMCVEGHPLPFALFLAFIPLAGIVEAARAANHLNARALGAVDEPEDDFGESPYWGAGLVVIGLVILGHNLGWLDLDKLVRFWPLLLVGAGTAFIWASLKKRNARSSNDDTPSL